MEDPNAEQRATFDPVLHEMLEEGDADDEVPVIVRLVDPAVTPEGVRPVARFGEIITARVRRGGIPTVRAHPNVASMKGPREVFPDRALEAVSDEDTTALPTDVRRPEGMTAAGRGVLVGIVDWGFDVAHPELRTATGRTRVEMLWDQRMPQRGAPNRYGYGRVHTRADIDRALATADPYRALGHHPADADPDGSGSHGTHVTSIAAGTGSVAPAGMAPEASLALVHLGTHGRRDPSGRSAFIGDYVTLLEAIDMIVGIAGGRPCVINLSMGQHTGPHDGRTLVELGFDALLTSMPGICIVQSAGNYYDRRIHTAGQLRPGEERSIRFITDPADITPNEVDLWLDHRDRVRIEVRSPSGQVWRAGLGERVKLIADTKEIGALYHRARDPNNGDHQVDLFLFPSAPPGEWAMRLIGEDVVDGRFHAWIQRDAGCPGCQSHFHEGDAVPTHTLGSICSGYRTIAVGAFDAHSPGREIAHFSSAGPSRDGRVKPDLVAPGARILAARSAPRGARAPATLTTRKSGTSMASPYVAGTVALMFEAAGRPLAIHETRALLLGSAEPAREDEGWRTGSGYCVPERAIAAARALAEAMPLGPSRPRTQGGRPMAEQEIETMATDIDEHIEEATAHDEGSEEALVGQARIGSEQVVLSIGEPAAFTATTFDAALAWSCRDAGAHVILGDTLAGDRFAVHRLEGAVPDAAPSVIEVDARADVAAVTSNAGEVVYVRADPRGRALRWVRIPRVREFYGLPAADQRAHRQRWTRALQRAAAVPAADVPRLGMAAVRVLIANAAARALPIQTVMRGTPRQDRGGMTPGVTVPIIRFPIREPECYLSVISEAEGKLEAVNAWDWGAGISIGPIQFNAQDGSLHRALWQLSQADPDLFAQEIGGPLGWTVQWHDGHADLTVDVHGVPTVLHGTRADGERSYRYLQSGDPAGRGYAPDFRRRLAERFRNVLVWPHIQEIVLEISADWLRPGLRSIERAGVGALDPRAPDRDTFVLKALLMSAYVRFSGCLDPLLRELAAWGSVTDKLAHWRDALARTTARCRELEPRLDGQERDAARVHDAIRRLAAPPAELEEVALVDASDRAAEERWDVIEAADALLVSEATIAPLRLLETLGASAGDLRIVAGPGDRADAVRVGDVVLTTFFGEQGAGQVSVVAGPGTWAGAWPYAGVYVPAVEGDARSQGSAVPRQRRLTDAAGRVLPDRLVLRIEQAEDLDLDRAVQENRRYGTSLGWIAHLDRLLPLLGFTTYSPDERTFAQAVAEWQARQGLTRDGILGPRTWERMRHQLGIVAARPVTGVAARGGRAAVLTTSQLRDAWRDYECAESRMVPLRIYGTRTPVNPETVDAWRALEAALRAAGYEAQSAWVYNCRVIAGTATRSLHAYGLALDLDPRCNPNRPTPDERPVRFSSASTREERCRDVDGGTADTIFTPDQIAAVEAIRTADGHQVFAWGGRWRTSKDTMHFQINVTPAELRRGLT